ncbi:hypothetical protein FCV25MIE_00276 [Fagus crenata]
MWKGTLLSVAQVLVTLSFLVTLFTIKPLEAAMHLNEMKSTQGSNKVTFPENKAPVSPSKPPEAESPVEYDTGSTVLGGNKVSFPEDKGEVASSSPNPCTNTPKGVNGHCNK